MVSTKDMEKADFASHFLLPPCVASVLIGCAVPYQGTVRSAFEEHKRREALELAKLKKAGRHASPAGLLSAGGGGGAGGLDGVSRCTAPHVGTTVPRPAHNCVFCYFLRQFGRAARGVDDHLAGHVALVLASPAAAARAHARAPPRVAVPQRLGDREPGDDGRAQRRRLPRQGKGDPAHPMCSLAHDC